jgi:hypothetical protein
LTKLIAGVSVLVAILAAHTALAGLSFRDNPEYGGKLDEKNDRYFGFNVRGSGDDRELTKMFLVNIPFHGCDDRERNGEQLGKLRGPVPVAKNGAFDKTRSYDNPVTRRGAATGLTYRVEGKLDGDSAVEPSGSSFTASVVSLAPGTSRSRSPRLLSRRRTGRRGRLSRRTSRRVEEENR